MLHKGMPRTGIDSSESFVIAWLRVANYKTIFPFLACTKKKKKLKRKIFFSIFDFLLSSFLQFISVNKLENYFKN